MIIEDLLIIKISSLQDNGDDRANIYIYNSFMFFKISFFYYFLNVIFAFLWNALWKYGYKVGTCNFEYISIIQIFINREKIHI